VRVEFRAVRQLHPRDRTAAWWIGLCIDRGQFKFLPVQARIVFQDFLASNASRQHRGNTVDWNACTFQNRSPAKDPGSDVTASRARSRMSSLSFCVGNSIIEIDGHELAVHGPILPGVGINIGYPKITQSMHQERDCFTARRCVKRVGGVDVKVIATHPPRSTRRA